MELLFRREQTTGKVGRVNFKLWAKLELDENEQALVKRYKFDQSQIVDETQPKLIRNSAVLGILAGLIATVILDLIFPASLALVLGLAAAIGAGYWWYNEKRERLYVKDLLHGRHFTCPSIIDLAKKEAWLTDVSSLVRQVMESAKHWDGTEKHVIEALPKEEARQVMLNAF